MTPEEIKALRKELACTARELGAVLEVDQGTVFAWERAEIFPTKQYVDRMAALRAAGPSAFPRKTKPVPRAPALAPAPHGAGSFPMKALADPAFWAIVRKILAHERLREEVARLSAGYPDPVGSPSSSPGSAMGVPESSGPGTVGSGSPGGIPPGPSGPSETDGDG